MISWGSILQGQLHELFEIEKNLLTAEDASAVPLFYTRALIAYFREDRDGLSNLLQAPPANVPARIKNWFLQQ